MGKSSFHKSQKEDEEFKKIEWKHLHEGLKRSHQERFLFMTQLYKIQQTLQKATITHKPFRAHS